MATAKEIKFVQLSIRLGAFPSFEMLADDRVRVAPGDAKFATSTAAGAPDALLTTVLEALLVGGPSIELFVEDGVVVMPEDGEE